MGRIKIDEFQGFFWLFALVLCFTIHFFSLSFAYAVNFTEQQTNNQSMETIQLGSSAEDQVRNDVLQSAYAQMQQAKMIREQIKLIEMDRTGLADNNSYLDLSAKFDMFTENISKSYSILLQDPNNKNNFWVNWDFASLWVLIGSQQYASLYTAMALSGLSMEQQNSMVNEIKAKNLAQLGWDKDYSFGKLKQSMIDAIAKKTHNWIYDNSMEEKRRWAMEEVTTDLDSRIWIAVIIRSSNSKDVQQLIENQGELYSPSRASNNQNIQ